MIVYDQSPAVLVTGANPLRINLNEAFVDPGATCAGTYTGNFYETKTGSVDTSSPGKYTIEYFCIGGTNVANATRTVIVSDPTPIPVDSTIPTIAIASGNPPTLDALREGFGVTCNDNNPTTLVTRVSHVSDSNAYVASHTCTDSAGNVAVEIRIVSANVIGNSPTPLPAVSLSISGNGAEGEDVTFGIESVPPPLTPLDVTISLDQTGGILADSNTGQRTITIPTSGFASFTIPTIDDGIVDDNTITITILDGNGYTVGVPSSNTITIPDNDVAIDGLIGLSDSVQEPETPQPETPEQPSFTADPTLIANIKEYAAETYRGQEHVDRWHRVLKTLGVEEFPGLTTMTSGEAYTFVQQGWNRWIPVVAELKAFETWQQQPQPEQPQQPPQQQPIPVNLVSNSSFEAPIVTAHNGQWQQFAPSTAGISWTVTGDSLEIQRGILGGASDGSQHAELDAQGSVTISQTLSTVSGQAYEISFDYKARPNTASNTNGMNVTWNGVDIAPNLTLGNTWQTYTVNVTGTGSDTISFADAGTSDGIGTFLDNVSVMRTGSPPQ